MISNRRGYTDLDPADAPDAVRGALLATQKKLGFLPSAMARMAHAPALPRAFQQALAAFESTSLSALERETAVLVMARRLGCDVCIAMHARALRALGEPALVAALLAGDAPADPRLAALASMIESLLERHGDVEAEVWERFLAAGLTRAQALELVVGVGAYTMSIVANRLTEAPVDAALA